MSARNPSHTFAEAKTASTVSAYGAMTSTSKLTALKIPRREVGSEDVCIDILYCGVCHSDIHTARNDWGSARYPVVPGHEIVGRVRNVGQNVEEIAIGDIVAVGCLVDSCRTCDACRDDLEQYCENGSVGTYNGRDRHLGGHTYGGYSDYIVVDKEFVLRVPESLDISRVGPLLCAGITCYSPLRHWGIKKGDKVGIIGLGGLGHLGVKLAHAMGAYVVMVTRSLQKAEDAQLLGADEVLVSTDIADMKASANSFDFLLNTIPVGHDVDPYVRLLKRDATMVMVGAIEPLTHINSGLLVGKRKSIAGSLIGGIAETQEMLDFCAEHNILPEVEMIEIQDINEAWDRVVSGDVKYRFVIDMKSLNA